MHVALGVQGVANPIVDDLCIEQTAIVAAAAQSATPSLLAFQINPPCAASPATESLTIDQPVIIAVAARTDAPNSQAIQIELPCVAQYVPSACGLVGARTIGRKYPLG